MAQKQPLKILELFAGIGACSKALERLRIPHEIVDAVEIDKYAIKSFNAIHDTDFEQQDITKWDKNIECDLIMHGSPCQDFSIAGKQAGGNKGSGTRSSLMYETLRIVEKLKPRYVIWENVKNLLSEKHRPNFESYQKAMADLHYANFVDVLNAKDYGMPQNRERVFTVSILRHEKMSGWFWPTFKFPSPVPLKLRLQDLLEDEVDEKFYLSEKQLGSLLASNYDQNKRFYKTDGVAPTISTMGGGQRQPKIIQRACRKNIAFPETCCVRKLTPLECWRLMGFDDADFARASKVNSNTQLYKQAGNSIVVNVLEGVLKSLIKEEI